jgi:cytoskeletal protein CcmA (bactofilin family)
MWWEKKARPDGHPDPKLPSSNLSSETPTPAAEHSTRNAEMPTANPNQTVIGRSMVLRGDLSGKEDLLIEGQFEGTIHLPEHCVTVGANGEVKAETHARQVVILGSVTGNINAGERIEIRKTGRVVGDLVAAAIAIEDGAFFKGSIDIVRDQGREGVLVAQPVARAET